jgi:hypothetical protein
VETITTPPATETPVPEPPVPVYDERIFPLLTGIGVGLLIGGLIAVIISLIRRRDAGDDDEPDLSDGKAGESGEETK